MGICLYGSKKKADAQAFFSVNDSGAFCSLLGINATICPLLDIIPSLIGLPWRKIIEKIGKASFSLLVLEATGQIDTAIFCSLEPPKLPDDINYADVFAWILSYVPVIGGFSTDDPLLKKITAYYLYSKWFELCECKKPVPKEPLQDALNPYIAPLLPIDADGLQCSSTYYQSAASMNILIGAVNNQNKSYAATSAFYNKKQSDYYFGEVLPYVENLRNQGYVVEDAPDIINQNSGYTISGSPQYIGCISYRLKISAYKMIIRGRFKPSPSNQVAYYGYDIGYETELIVPSRYYEIDISQCSCDPKPPNPFITKDNPPIPPPDFCDLFPNNPLCPQNPCDIESINILLFDGCNKPRKSATRLLFKSGQNLPVDVSVFDGCDTIRKIETKILFNC